MKSSISVIVGTCNRPVKLDNCLKSVLANNFPPLEMIVVDQGDGGEARRVVQSISNSLIRYFSMKKKGLSRARNLGIEKAKGEIVVFVDDDCIVKRGWLKKIYKSFGDNRQAAAVIGKYLPYKPELHLGLSCVGVSKFRKKRELISFSNNKSWDSFCGGLMAFRMTVFKKVGFFKEWLDLGSAGMYSGDTDLFYRLFKMGEKVIVDPEILVYHDHWLTDRECDKRLARMTCGFFATFSFHTFGGDEMARRYLVSFMRKKEREWQKIFKNLIGGFHLKHFFRALFIDFPFEIYYSLRGFIIAFYFAYLRRDCY